MKKVVFKTLGCRLNQFETDALAMQFVNHGYEVSEDEEGADIVVVNTCTVTNQSNQKSRNVISHAGSKNASAKIFITGCMAVSHKDQLNRKFPDAIVIDNENKSAIFHKVDALVNNRPLDNQPHDLDLFSYESAFDLFHTRSLVKIQDGCDNFCSYCIIPFVRGRGISRPVNDIINNIQELIGKGAREIVLTGVNISRYNFQGVVFSELLEKILSLEGIFRVRISSIEPDRFDDRLIGLIQHPKLAPHFHLCLQSGSDTILRQMRRMYTKSDFMNIVERVRFQQPLFNFTTDAIVGFPGETDEDFKETLHMSKEVGFGHMHIFKYSVRENTRAQRMENHIPEKVKSERSKVLHALADELKMNYRQRVIHQSHEVLVERIKNGVGLGYSQFYAPFQIQNNDSSIKRNQFVNVIPLQVLNEEDYPYLVSV